MQQGCIGYWGDTRTMGYDVPVSFTDQLLGKGIECWQHHYAGVEKKSRLARR